MRNLLLLIRKDWMLFIANKRNFFGCLLIWIPLTTVVPTSTIISFIATTYILIVGLFQFEENNLVCNISAILPVCKHDVVLARHLYAYTVIAAQALLACLLQPAMRFFLRGTNFDGSILPKWFIALLVALCVSLFMLAITLPFIYKFGFFKTRFYVAFIYLFLVISSYSIYAIVQSFWREPSVSVIPLHFLFALFGGCLLFSLGSMAISLRVAR